MCIRFQFFFASPPTYFSPPVVGSLNGFFFFLFALAEDTESFSDAKETLGNAFRARILTTRGVAPSELDRDSLFFHFFFFQIKFLPPPEYLFK